MTIENILARIPAEWGKYIDVGPGWYKIIIELDSQIAALDPDYTVAQVKQKFGGLRYYLHNIDPAFSERANRLIAEAEGKASRTCEICGSQGELVTANMWWHTVCDSCAKT